MSIILTFFLYIFTQCYTFQKRLKVSLSYMFTMISYGVEISIIANYICHCDYSDVQYMT